MSNRRKNTASKEPLVKSSANIQIQQTHEVKFHQGPLPAPEQLEAYEKACPGAADRIIAMAEKQAAHRQALESITVKGQQRNSLLGLITGFLLGTIAIISGAYVAVNGASWAGFGTACLGVAGLVSVFVYGKKAKNKELIEKQKLINQMKEN